MNKKTNDDDVQDYLIFYFALKIENQLHFESDFPFGRGIPCDLYDNAAFRSAFGRYIKKK